MSFSDLGLAPELLQAIADQGYTEPTPVQAKAIPPILLGQDVMAAAQTGTGKTASFTLPMLQRLKEFANNSVLPARHQVRALILTPTRELAAQVQESVKIYGKHIALRSAVVYGGINIDPQIKELRAGVEILVATPGRLLDHLQQKTVSLSQVQFLVLDEADRMLDMGFLPDIKRILAVLPAQRQSVMFSATYSDDIRGLAKQLLKNPVNIEVARRNSAVETVTHLVYHVESSAKRDLLTHLIRSRDMRQALVFCNTKIGANRLAYKLVKDGVAAAAIHSDRTQGERTQALAEFKEGRTQILVATDVAARGLDIEQLPFVINFDLPGARSFRAHGDEVSPGGDARAVLERGRHFVCGHVDDGGLLCVDNRGKREERGHEQHMSHRCLRADRSLRFFAQTEVCALRLTIADDDRRALCAGSPRPQEILSSRSRRTRLRRREAASTRVPSSHRPVRRDR